MKNAMLIDATQTRQSLERMVVRLTSQSLWREDLVQEALTHLWEQERRCPGHSAFWYLRSCRFFVQNRLRQGRSIDSPKRCNGHVIPLDADDGAQAWSDVLADPTEGASVVEVVIAHDLLSALLSWLTPAEREILDCLLNGLGVRETARRLKLSHTCVTTKRRRIAALTCKLEPDLQPRNGFRPTQPRRAKPSTEPPIPRPLDPRFSRAA